MVERRPLHPPHAAPLGLPALLVLLLGKRAHVFLPKVRDWMNTNSWIVNEIVIVFFIAITINSLARTGDRSH